MKVDEKKIQRFISLPSINVKKLCPITKSWLEQDFDENQTIYLVIDRTSWARVNLFMVSLDYQQRNIPIYFQLLTKLRSSNFSEQTEILSLVLPLFVKCKVCLLGDREFCSVKLANWLRDSGVFFCLSLKNSEFIELKNGIWLELNSLGLKPGVSFFIPKVKMTETVG